MRYGRSEERSVEIIGKKGTIYTNFNDTVEVYDENGNLFKKRFGFERNDIFKEQFLRFEKLIQGGKVDYASGYDGLEVIKICQNLYCSDNTGKAFIKDMTDKNRSIQH
jgi:predicted dehydrogenase